MFKNLNNTHIMWLKRIQCCLDETKEFNLMYYVT